MNTGDPIEEQGVWMFSKVYGNPGQSMEDLRVAFYQQEPSVVEGWKRLARSVDNITTLNTLEFLLTKTA